MFLYAYSYTCIHIYICMYIYIHLCIHGKQVIQLPSANPPQCLRCSAGWLNGWLVEWSAGWLNGWLVEWLIDCLAVGCQHPPNRCQNPSSCGAKSSKIEMLGSWGLLVGPWEGLGVVLEASWGHIGPEIGPRAPKISKSDFWGPLLGAMLGAKIDKSVVKSDPKV